MQDTGNPLALSLTESSEQQQEQGDWTAGAPTLLPWQVLLCLLTSEKEIQKKPQPFLSFTVCLEVKLQKVARNYLEGSHRDIANALWSHAKKIAKAPGHQVRLASIISWQICSPSTVPGDCSLGFFIVCTSCPEHPWVTKLVWIAALSLWTHRCVCFLQCA